MMEAGGGYIGPQDQPGAVTNGQTKSRSMCQRARWDPNVATARGELSAYMQKQLPSHPFDGLRVEFDTGKRAAIAWPWSQHRDGHGTGWGALRDGEGQLDLRSLTGGQRGGELFTGRVRYREGPTRWRLYAGVGRFLRCWGCQRRITLHGEAFDLATWIQKPQTIG